MGTSRRIVLSFACVLFVCLTLCLGSLVGLVGTRAQRLYQLHTDVEMLPVYLLFALPGWFIALPFVVLLKDAQGWRGWFILLVGTCIGPGFMLTWILISSSGRLTWQGSGYALVMSLIISFPTTMFYCFALRLAQSRSIAPKK